MTTVQSLQLFAALLSVVLLTLLVLRAKLHPFLAILWPFTPLANFSKFRARCAAVQS